MDKKIIGMVIAVLVLAGVFGVFLSKNITKQQSKKEAVKEIIPSENLTTYADPSGFSFGYPDNLRLEKKVELDSTTYADLKLVSDETKGGMTVKITDTKFKTIEEYLTGENKEIMLGNLSGREFVQGEKVTAVVIDKGVLFIISTEPDNNKNFWQKVHETVLASFTFNAPASSNDSGSSANVEEVVFEGEEIIE
ncbi:hypothetical protein HYS29_01235 [Candidatus Microgenomates bacterium]|nr:hypothetical protein [Candidatus Microgenomates bacterium]